ncbi:NEW3 domain-containing protein [Micromonospora sp. NPDC051296]|uniref:COG1470 family protein n=1 Tax=Micromonospora sp. NPDC051296 TaxID=3155046 RepID=UPI0034323BD5
MPAGIAGRLATPLTQVDQRLSAASSALIGVVARLDLPVGEWLPGDVVPATVTVENTGGSKLNGLTSTLRAPEGWTVTPVAGQDTSVAPGATVRHGYRVRIPAGQSPTTANLSGEVSYRYQAGSATLPVAGPLGVAPAVEIVSAAAQPAEVTPGATATVRTVLRNRATAPVTGRLTTTGPEGWRVEPGTADYQLAAGAETTLETRVIAPLSVTEGPASITVASGTTAAESRTLGLPVRIPNPPAVAHDHIDLGDLTSERAHNLAASTHSGTSTEAGLTRRYTNVTYPGGWFEFDLAVEAGKPFILRVVETYDQAQLKDYDVLVDGVVVHARAFRRTAGGAGTVTYQFVVDRPDLTADGKVRVRFLDTGEGYDPSIADVWAVPVDPNS